MLSTSTHDGSGPASLPEAPAVLHLDDGRALDGRLTGATAAALARAGRHGLPVVPGVVVPTVAVERMAAGTPPPGFELRAREGT